MMLLAAADAAVIYSARGGGRGGFGRCGGVAELWCLRRGEESVFGGSGGSGEWWWW